MNKPKFQEGDQEEKILKALIASALIGNPKENMSCPECDSTNLNSLGVIEYGADYQDSEWYENCQWGQGYLCLDCNTKFVDLDDEDE